MKKIISLFLPAILLNLIFVAAQPTAIPSEFAPVASSSYYLNLQSTVGNPTYNCEQWKQDLDGLNKFCSNVQLHCQNSLAKAINLYINWETQWSFNTIESIARAQALYGKITAAATAYNQCLALQNQCTTLYNKGLAAYKKHCP